MKDMTTESAGSAGLERPRYFARQLVTPTDLNLEADYFRNRLRRHNRSLHGWGVVCGALVCRVPASDGVSAEPWEVIISPGELIDGCFDDVAITKNRIVDLRSEGFAAVDGDPSGEYHDPWCSDDTVKRTGKTFIAVRYHQGLSRPVRVQPVGCGCDDTACEYARWSDGYEIRLLDRLPLSHQGDPPAFEGPLTGNLGTGLASCPPCPDDAWVVLASVEVDSEGAVTAIDNCSYRRMVVSLAGLWWRCTTKTPSITKVTPTPPKVKVGATGKLMVSGANIDKAATADLGAGIKITIEKVGDGGDTMELSVKVWAGARLGDRSLTITNPDCSIATFPVAITIA